jgi:hypothetical protein
MTSKEQPEEPLDVEETLRRERARIRPERKDLKHSFAETETAPEKTTTEKAKPVGPSALCLSGGGIRSASFALGFLQACDRRSLITKFDYLFTVSGGGYIGGWLTALLHRKGNYSAKTVGIDEDHGAIDPQGLGAQAVANLRRYSNYLTPRLGLLSGDSLSLIAIYVRNLILNGLILLPLLAGAVIVPRIVYHCFAAGSLTRIWGNELSLVVIGILALGSGSYSIYAATQKGRSIQPPSSLNHPPQTPSEYRLSADGFVMYRIFPILLCALLLSAFAYANGKDAPGMQRLGWISLIITGLCSAVLFVFGLVHGLLPNKSSMKVTYALLHVMGAYALVGVVFFLGGKLGENSLVSFIFGPPALLIIYLLAGVLFAGLVNPLLSDDDREWWARAAGYLLLTSFLWLLFASLSHCRELYAFLAARFPTTLRSDVFQWIAQLPQVTAAVSGIAALLTRQAHVAQTNDKKNDKGDAKASDKNLVQSVGQIIFRFACPIFIVSLLLSLSIGTSFIVERGTLGKAKLFSFGSDPQLDLAGNYLTLFVILMCVSLALSCVVNINKFSLHNTYRNRLIRTFLGASNKNRSPNPFTGFDENDNLLLAQIDEKQRPFHVICGAVNLYAGANLAWQERRAALFTFSPISCGSDFLYYRPSESFGGPKGLSIGTAMAISGAAANPNMGFYTSPDRAFVMTLFNVRLGWWLGNPRSRTRWQSTGPFPALWPLTAEMFLLTRETSSFINVSDGGHFDDTGVYEAVRRRCSLIFLVDADASHENVARMIRKVRIDFGVDIVQTNDLSGEGVPAFVYLVQYPDSKQGPSFNGKLVRVYPSLLPFKDGLPADVAKFADGDPAFPTDQLENQWYGEAQFESYRKLGREIGMRLFNHSAVQPVISRL